MGQYVVYLGVHFGVKLVRDGAELAENVPILSSFSCYAVDLGMHFSAKLARDGALNSVLGAIFVHSL